MALRDVLLVDASISADATFAEAVATLSATSSSALALLDGEGRVVGLFTEGDLLRAVFPGYLDELRHTAFLTDDTATLDQVARAAHDRPVRAFARPAITLDVEDSQVHAAERMMHTREHALPVLDGGRFVGMLTVEALCLARLRRVEEQ